MKRRYKVQSASNARSQGLVKSFCGSSPGQWAILQLLCSQVRRKLQDELPKKILPNLENELLMNSGLLILVIFFIGSHRHGDVRHLPEVHPGRRAAGLDRLLGPLLAGRLAVPPPLLLPLHPRPQGPRDHRQRREPVWGILTPYPEAEWVSPPESIMPPRPIERSSRAEGA